MNKHKLLLIAGLPATGKSTFAAELSRRLCIPAYSKDRLNEISGTYLNFPDSRERKKLSEASFHLLLYIAAQALTMAYPVILESNFKPREEEAIRALIAHHRCDTLTFVFTGDMRRIYDRFMAREMSAERHPIHKSHGLNEYELFKNAVAPLAGFDIGGERVVIDAGFFDRVDYGFLYQRAEAFLRT